MNAEIQATRIPHNARMHTQTRTSPLHQAQKPVLEEFSWEAHKSKVFLTKGEEHLQNGNKHDSHGQMGIA